jgi:hypothetical protein
LGQHRHPCAAALLALLTTLLIALPSHAHRNGIQVYGCWGCHGSTNESTLTLSQDPATVLPGDTVNFTATVAFSGMKAAGLFIAKPDLGELALVADEGLTLSDGALTHTAPKNASDGQTTFRFTWTAPAEPGAVTIDAFGLATNGNNRNTGDAPGEARLQFTFGCEPQLFYFDADHDGHAAPTADGTLGCADQPPPLNYAGPADDCDDARDWVHPDAPERCNGKDDDCDGEIDENTMPETLYPDPDGDGFYMRGAAPTIVGCLPLDGYADVMGDCDGMSATAYPGAEEVCDLFDNNCDGRIDEFVRPRCGVGRCEREGPTCDPDDCVPGVPQAETCNSLDDDCDGEVDDEEPCGADAVCLGLRCVPLEPSAGGAEGSGLGGTTGGGAEPASGGAGAMPNGATGGTGMSMAATGGTRGGTGSVSGGAGATGGVPGAGGSGAESAGQATEPVTLRAGESRGCGTSTGSRSSNACGLILALGALASLRRRAERSRRTP